VKFKKIARIIILRHIHAGLENSQYRSFSTMTKTTSAKTEPKMAKFQSWAVSRPRPQSGWHHLRLESVSVCVVVRCCWCSECTIQAAERQKWTMWELYTAAIF